jgi:very-short-patch-repair endonuclease
MDEQNATHRRFARLADAQHGVIARRQLAALGVGRGAIDGRIDQGLLIPLHRGVYALGHRRLTRNGRWLAAVLAAGPGAALSHRDAGALHGIGPWRQGPIEVTSPRRGRSTPAIHLFPRRLLTPADVTTVAAIPVTTVARTLVDLAELLHRDRLLHALTEAERSQQLDLGAVEAAMARTRGRHGRGHANLRAALEETGRRGLQLTRSDLEIALRRMAREHDLPPAQHNAIVHGEEVDAWWPQARMVVEADGWEFHRGRAAFARDREKSNVLTLHGCTVLRFTHDDVVRRPARTAAAIRRALAGG